MSVWRRVKGWLGPPGVAEEPAVEAGAVEATTVAASPPDRGAPGAPRSPASLLEEAASPQGEFDRQRALAAIDALVSDAREPEALRLGRRVLAAHPAETEIALRLAELAASRGDDALAAQLIGPATEGAAALLPALVLAGELAERRGDVDAALAAYERALARDVDYPRAKERAARLREARGGRRELAGATLLADGALAQGRYRVLRELGRGGAGTAFAVRDLRTERVVALKLYHGRSALDRERLRGEARVAAALEHPGVVRIFDLDEALLAIAMEHLPGGSVRDALRRSPVPFARAQRWLLTAAEVLDYVHRQGFVHRDIKPSNWLVRADDRVVLTDFGLARRRGELPGASGTAEAGGEGTLAYMPPEQRAGAAADPAADVHAFGATVRELLTHVIGAVPPGLLEVATACLAPEPRARPTLEAVRDALRATPA
jgi:serine/threonine-protein kinase